MKVFITKKSMFSGLNHTKEFEMTEAQFATYTMRPRPHIQNIFPSMSPSDCEFLLTGVTAEEWDAAFVALYGRR